MFYVDIFTTSEWLCDKFFWWKAGKDGRSERKKIKKKTPNKKHPVFSFFNPFINSCVLNTTSYWFMLATMFCTLKLTDHNWWCKRHLLIRKEFSATPVCFTSFSSSSLFSGLKLMVQLQIPVYAWSHLRK